MAKAHDLGFLREFIFQPRFRTIRCLDFIEHTHRLLIGAAMQRPLERAACTRHRRVNIRQRRRRHPCRKSRGVKFMIGIQNKNRVHYPDLPILRHLASQLVEEISGHRQILTLRQRIFIVCDAIPVRD